MPIRICKLKALQVTRRVGKKGLEVLYDHVPILHRIALTLPLGTERLGSDSGRSAHRTGRTLLGRRLQAVRVLSWTGSLAALAQRLGQASARVCALRPRVCSRIQEGWG